MRGDESCGGKERIGRFFLLATEILEEAHEIAVRGQSPSCESEGMCPFAPTPRTTRRLRVRFAHLFENFSSYSLFLQPCYGLRKRRAVGQWRETERQIILDEIAPTDCNAATRGYVIRRTCSTRPMLRRARYRNSNEVVNTPFLIRTAIKHRNWEQPRPSGSLDRHRTVLEQELPDEGPVQDDVLPLLLVLKSDVQVWAELSRPTLTYPHASQSNVHISARSPRGLGIPQSVGGETHCTAALFLTEWTKGW